MKKITALAFLLVVLVLSVALVGCHEHQYTERVVVPTCEEGGYTVYTCECGETYQDDFVEPLGHTEVVDSAVDATCTSDGLTEGKHCSVCNKVLVAQNTVGAAGHSYQETVVDPTCTEKGYTLHKCACGDEYKDSYVDALGHDEQRHDAQTPTCEEDGYKEYVTCSRCDYTTYQVDPATGHSFKETVVDPTCTEQGYTVHQCHCGDEYTDTYVDELGHTEVIDPAVAATCTKTGLTEGKHCSVCESVLVDQRVVETNSRHTAGDPEKTNEKAADCTTTGSYDLVVRCIECGRTLSSETVQVPVCHTYGDDGVCTKCNVTKGVTFTLSDDGESYSVSDYGESEETDVVIPSTYNGKPVTGILSYAFYYCKSITNITIPSSVTEMRSEAFIGCESITKVNYLGTIDQWVQIGFGSEYSNPVYYAKNLYINNQLVTEVKLTTATSIGMCAFEACSSLTSIEIPASVTFIGNKAFSDCSNLEKVNYLGTIDQWVQIEFSGYSNNPLSQAKNFYINNELVTEANITTASSVGNYVFAGYNGLTSVKLGDSVTSVGEGAFYYCENLVSVTMSNSVTSMGSYAFHCCSSLVNVTLSENLKSIGYNVFSGCHSLTSVTIPAGVKEIYGSTFASCRSLESVVFAENSQLKSIGYGVFWGCYNLTNITIPDGVTTIGTDAFWNCFNLMRINIPQSVTSITQTSFANCFKLIEVVNKSALDVSEACYLAQNITNIETSSRLYTDENGFVLYQDGEVWLVNYVGSETEIEIPQNVTKINNRAFRSTGVTSVTVPARFTADDIGRAFCDCDTLTTVVFAEGSKLRSVCDSMFYGCTNLTEIVLPQGITSIGKKAFYNCKNLTEFTIPSSVTSVGENAFSGCVCLTIYCEAESKPSDWASQWSGGGTVVWDCKNNDETQYGIAYVVVDGIRYALKSGEASVERQRSTIVSAIIPSSITYNGKYYSVTSVGAYAFDNCSNLVNVVLPDTVTTLGNGAFRNCVKLTNIVIPSNVTKINFDAFTGCTGLTSVTFGENSQIETIGSTVFDGCTGLTSLVIPRSVTSVGRNAFYNCPSLTINYMGTKAEWMAIVKGEDAVPSTITVTYNYGK